MRYIILALLILWMVQCDPSEGQDPLQLRIEFVTPEQNEPVTYKIYRWQGYDTTNVNYEFLESVDHIAAGDTLSTQYYLWDYDKIYRAAGYAENSLGQRSDTVYTIFYQTPHQPKNLKIGR